MIASSAAISDAVRNEDEPDVVLTLFVNGRGARSRQVIQRLRRFIDGAADRRFSLEIVDVSADRAALVREQIVAIPTLIRCRPEPVTRFIGDLATCDTILPVDDWPAP